MIDNRQFSQVAERLGTAILQITQGLASKYKSDDDQISEAVCMIWSAIERGKIRTDQNVFAYLTQVAKNAFHHEHRSRHDIESINAYDAGEHKYQRVTRLSGFSGKYRRGNNV